MSTPFQRRVVLIAFGAVVFFWTGFTLIGALAGVDLDNSVIQNLRDPDNPSRMIGPPALQEFMRDITALGGYTVLVSAVVVFAAWQWVAGRRKGFVFFTTTCVSAYLFGVLIKLTVGRVRPSVVPHLSFVSGETSLPSSHAMMSAVVYLSIGLILSRQSHGQDRQRLLTVIPLCMSFLVGVSRIFMGVHFPSDVFAGWSAGLLWIWGALQLHRRFAENVTDESLGELPAKS